MSLRNFLRKIAGRAGKATRATKGANSHVNTKANKRAASKAVRTCDWYRDECLDDCSCNDAFTRMLQLDATEVELKFKATMKEKK